MDSIFLYVEKNGEITITGLQEGVATTSIVIPETIDNMPVVAIGPQAFQSTSITDIKIGESSATWNHKCDVIPADCFFWVLEFNAIRFFGHQKS